jgi:hypothetical protein
MGLWFSLGTLVSSTKKTYLHDMTEILLKVALDTITLTILNSNVPYYAVISLNCDLFSTVDEQAPFSPACSMFCEFYETWCKGLIHLHKYDVARKKAEKYLEMSINQVTSIGCKTSIFLFLLCIC